MKIIANSFNNTLLATTEYKNQNKIKRPRKLWYNKKSVRSASKIKNILNFAYYEKFKKDNLQPYFLTITTCQHRTGYSDRKLYSCLHNWLKNNREMYYVNILERQRETGDIHYHLIVFREKAYDIQRELNSLAKKFGIQPHPAIFDVERIKQYDVVRNYVTKYITKSDQYSSLFQCRTFSISGALKKEYKRGIYKYISKLPNENGVELLNFMNKNKLTKVKFFTDFFRTYQLNTEISKKISEYSSPLLKKLAYEGGEEWTEKNEFFFNYKLINLKPIVVEANE